MVIVRDHEGVDRYVGNVLGIVADNKDPRGLGRVRVTVPGLFEPSGWALAVGGAHSSGAAGRGGFDVPPIGAGVLFGCSGGDPDVPYYLGGWKGTGEQVSAQPDAPANVDKIKVYETDRFLVVLNGIGGAEELLVKDKVSNAMISMKPEQIKITANKVTVVADEVELGADELGNAPLVNGVVLGSGIDTFTGATYGALGSASSKITAKKG